MLFRINWSMAIGVVPVAMNLMEMEIETESTVAE